MELELEADRLDRLGRGLLSENRLGDVAGQQLGAGEDHHRDDEQGDKPGEQALEDQPRQSGSHRPDSGYRLKINGRSRKRALRDRPLDVFAIGSAQDASHARSAARVPEIENAPLGNSPITLDRAAYRLLMKNGMQAPPSS